jgi:iron complex outermembrane receptor protein
VFGKRRPAAPFLSCLILATLLAATATRVRAQEPPGRISGRVLKGDKGVVGVVVLVAELRVAEVTGEDGRFLIADLPPGSYTLVLTLGDNNLTRPVVVIAGRTNEQEFVVDWDVGVTEKVRVTAAARAAKIVDAPSAVTEIPEEQVERAAATGQVPKVLEFTPGAEVTQSGLYDFNFNTRGFNSSLNRRVSTYIDGRDVGVVLLGAQEWAAISGGLGDVANLEFVRGPSAALYGANASSGVVNITTKAPRESMGNMVRLTAGELDTRAVDFRRADKIGKGWYYKITAGLKNSGDFTVSRNPDFIEPSDDGLVYPEYKEIEKPGMFTPFCDIPGETDCLPTEKTLFISQDNKIRYGSLRFDKYLADDSRLTFEAGLSDIEGPVFQTGIGRVQGLSSKRPFFRFAWGSERWNVLAHYARREGDQANLTKDLIKNFELITDTKRYGVEGQGNWSLAGNKIRLVAGAAYTKEEVDTTNPATGLQTVVWEPIDVNREAVFGQLDYTINRYFKTVFAGRLDWNTLHDTQFSPKAAFVYSIDPKNSIRLTYNEAFQVANYSEFFLHTRIAPFPLGGFVEAVCTSPALEQPIDCDAVDVDADGFTPILAVGKNDLELEQTQAWEIGYSGLLANRVFITLDYYNANNENFITDLVPQVGTIFGNTENCVDARLQPETDPTECPINTDYLPWIGPDDWETTELINPFGPNITAADALRAAVDGSVGGDSLGFRLAQDLDGSTTVVGRTYTNVGEVDTQGVDFGIQFFVTEALSIQASYSWFDFEILDNDVPEDPRCDLPIGNEDRPICIEDILLPNTPEHKGSLAVSYATPKWSVSMGGRWTEEFRWSAGVFQGPVPSYTTVDLTGSYSFNKLLTVGVNVANLFDNVNRQTFGGDLITRRALVNTTFRW